MRPSWLRSTLLASTVLAAPALAQNINDPAPSAPVALPAVALPTVDVGASRGTFLQDTQGFVSRRDATGTKTDTPLNEVPQSITVINREQLDSRQVQTLGEALRYTSGVQTENFGADPHVDFFAIRGFQTNDTGIYLNGLRVSPGVTALAPEPYGVERIDVLKGPASVLYGQNAPGGLVNLVSKRPSDTPFHEATILGGSFGRVQGQFDMGEAVPGTDGRVTWRLTGLFREAGTQVDRVPNDRQFLAPAVTWKVDDRTTVTLLTNWQHDTSAGAQFLPSEGTLFGNPNGRIPTSRFTGEQQFGKVDRTTVNVGYEIEHRLNDVFTLRQNARYSRIDYSQRQVYGIGLEPDLRTLDRSAYGQDLRSNIFTVDNQAQAKFRTGPLTHTVLVGAEYNHTTLDTVNRFGTATTLNVFRPVYNAIQAEPAIFTNTGQIQNLYGLYAQDQVKLDRLILTVGIRQDWVDNHTRNFAAGTRQDQGDDRFTYRVGLGYETPIGVTPYVGYSRSFQPVIGTNINGTAFQPTEGEQVEVGVKYQPTGMASYVTASAFQINQSNVSTTDPNNVFNTVQTGEVRVRGFEVEAQANLLRGLNLIATYTYLDPVVTKAGDATLNKQVGGIPRHAASGWLDYAFPETTPLKGVSVGGGVRFVGSTQASNFDLFKVRDRTVADLAARYVFGRDDRWKLAVNVNNLFDRTYVSRCDGAAFCYYGARREVLASLGVRW